MQRVLYGYRTHGNKKVSQKETFLVSAIDEPMKCSTRLDMISPRFAHHLTALTNDSRNVPRHLGAG